MPGNVEMADGARGIGTFRAEWGIPHGRQYSEERAKWVRERVREHMALQNVQGRAAAHAALKVEHLRRMLHLHKLRGDWS